MIGTWLACSANSVGANFCYQEKKKDDIEGEEAGWLSVALAIILLVPTSAIRRNRRRMTLKVRRPGGCVLPWLGTQGGQVIQLLLTGISRVASTGSTGREVSDSELNPIAYFRRPTNPSIQSSGFED